MGHHENKWGQSISFERNECTFVCAQAAKQVHGSLSLNAQRGIPALRCVVVWACDFAL